MNNSCITGTFSEFYRTESRSELWVSFFLTILCMVIYAVGIIVILRGSLDARQIVILISVAACLALLLLLVLKDGCSLSLFPIAGKEGMLTILDNKHVLRSGESLRLWSRPLRVVLFPLAGASTTTFEVGSLKRFHGLDDLFPEHNLSVPSMRTLSVSVSYTWRLSQTAPKETYLAFSNGQSLWQLSEYIESMVLESLVLLCHHDVELVKMSPRKSFSELTCDQMVLLLGRREQLGSPYHLEIQRLSIELVTMTTTRTPV